MSTRTGGAGVQDDDRRSLMRGEGGQLVLGLLGVLVAVVVIQNVGAGPVPVAVLLLPVMAMALVATPRVTGAVATVAVVIGLVEVGRAGELTNDLRLRLAALVVGSVLCVSLSVVRSRRERSLAEREAALLTAERQGEMDRAVALMLEQMPALTLAAGIPEVAQHACRIARDIFGSDSASYWQIEGEDAVLLAREPMSLPRGTRIPVTAFVEPAERRKGTRTTVVRRSSLKRLARATPAVRHTETVVGTNTPIRVGGVAVAYLGLGWEDEGRFPDTTSLAALDRFADQVAIAKTVVRKRLAQAEAHELGRRLQAGLLPVSLPSEGPVTIRSEYRPGTRDLLLGGDFLDVVRNADDDSICFLLGDVSGHGPEQAALGTMMRSAWVGVASLPTTTIKEWVRVLDYVVRERCVSDDLFVTAVMGRIDVRRRVLQYVLAGHPPPVLLTPDVVSLPTGDPPLGVLPEATCTLHSVELPERWSVLVVTDGLYEGRVRPDETERVGYDGFVDLLRARGDDPVRTADWLRDVADDMERRNGGPMPDDAAGLLLTVRES